MPDTTDTQLLLTYTETAKRLGMKVHPKKGPCGLHNNPRLRKALGFRYVPGVGMRTTPENIEAYKRRLFGK